MKVVQIIKEPTNEDISRFKRNKKSLPDWLFGKKHTEGSKIRVSDTDFQLYKEFLSEGKKVRTKAEQSNDV